MRCKEHSAIFKCNDEMLVVIKHVVKFVRLNNRADQYDA